MEQMVENGLEYTIEFVKLMLVAKYVMGYKLKKQTGVMFAVSLFCVVLASAWVDVSNFTMLYGILSVGIIGIGTIGKKRFLGMFLCYSSISIVDMAVGSLVVFFLHFDMQKVNDNEWISLLINSVSLIFIVIYSVIVKRKKKEKFRISNKMMPFYIIAVVFLTYFITILLFVEMGEKIDTYRYEIVIGLNVTIISFVIIFLISNRNQNENERLKLENRMNQNMLESQRDYYLMLLQKEAETKSFRHDIREQISCIRLLYDKKEYEELGKYISEIEQATLELSSMYQTGNDFVSAILNDMCKRFDTVHLEWSGRMPPLNLSYMDICTLFYNLLKNAFEAAVKTDEKTVKVVIQTYDFHLVIQVENSYVAVRQGEKGELISTKEEKGHGYGVGNIMRCVEKNDGTYQYWVENDVFVTKIVLPDVVCDERKE